MSDRLRVFIEEGSDCPFITTDSEMLVNIVSLDSMLGWMEWLYPHISVVAIEDLERILELACNATFTIDVIEVDAGTGGRGMYFRRSIEKIIKSGLDI